MARRVRNSFRQLPTDVHDALAKTKKNKSTTAYRRLKKMQLSKVTSLSSIRSIANKVSKKDKVKIVISQNMYGKDYADGCYNPKDKTIRIHPILSYYPKTYVKDVIDHEVDHAYVDRNGKSRIKGR